MNHAQESFTKKENRVKLKFFFFFFDLKKVKMNRNRWILRTSQGYAGKDIYIIRMILQPGPVCS